MNRYKYHERCLELLDMEQSQKLNHDPTKTTERKVQNTLRKINSKHSIIEYKRKYPTWSSPGKLYEIVKIHKLSNGGSIEKLLISSMIFNLNTAIYHLLKQLAKLLSPLSTLECTGSSSKKRLWQLLKLVKCHEFIICHMISFDVKSLFTDVPLKCTIEFSTRTTIENW